jgi:hypothetical protein
MTGVEKKISKKLVLSMCSNPNETLEIDLDSSMDNHQEIRM